MFKKWILKLRTRPAVMITALTLGAAVFGLVVLSAIIITFILPETYSSATRVKIPGESLSPDPASLHREIELIQSDAILGKVVENLDLKNAWAKKFGMTGSLTTAESIAFLRKQIQVRPIHDRLIEIRAFDQNSQQAAAIANEITEVYVAFESEANKTRLPRNIPTEPSPNSDPGVRIIDRAEATAKPALPNDYRNIAAGVLIGLILSTVVAALVMLLGFLFPNIKERTWR
jgi:uncharacterized protein involved in exopolysaccharide biosynthesis